MIAAEGVELRVGSRLLLKPADFRVGPGDRIGLVGRNGAGKTTLARVLAGEESPAAGRATSIGSVGYLPQDSRAGDLSTSARDRVLSARDLDSVMRELRAAEHAMADRDDRRREQAMRRYARLEERFTARGGYQAEAEAAAIASSLGLAERVLDQPLATLSGGQRRRVELARILFSGAETLLLDEPTNHLDADSTTWLRGFLRGYHGGLVVISHDVALLESVVTRVFHLDANRAELDQYTMGWAAYLTRRATDERRRRRDRANAERTAARLFAQAAKMHARASTATAAQNMARRAERLLATTEGERRRDKVARLRFPSPAPCGKAPLAARGLSRSYGSSEVFTAVDLVIDRGSRVVVLGMNGAGKTTLLRLLAGVDRPDTGDVVAGIGLRLGYYAQEHENLDLDRTVLENMRSAAPDLGDTEARRVLGSFLFTGDDVDKRAGVLSGGEKTRLSLALLVASAANVLLLDEPTNNLDPASRAEILAALSGYQGAVVLVTHDEDAVHALGPERVLLLPDGTEDLWSPSYADLVALA